MVELRKRPPPKEPAAPPPATKKRNSKPKPAKAEGSGVADKAKQAINKVKEAVGGSTDNKDKQPTVEDAPQVEKGETVMIPETATSAGDPGSITVPVPASSAPTAASAQGETSLPPTSEALENPPETGKIEPATTAAESAMIGGSIGPVAEPGVSAVTATSGASGSTEAKIPLTGESVGKLVHLESFGGEVETHDGKKVNVKSLIAENVAGGGIVLFTYPRASTPGCTQQACLFRDNYAPLTGSPANLKIFGLSTDSPKSNTTFATKQNLPYPLLCDPKGTLISAIGMKKPGGTIRGVVLIDGKGVVKVWFQGGPAKTLDVVKEYVATIGK